MQQLKKMKKLIAAHEEISANWINFPNIREIAACRKALIDADYELDTSGITAGQEEQFMNPYVWRPQEDWTPPARV